MKSADTTCLYWHWKREPVSPAPFWFFENSQLLLVVCSSSSLLYMYIFIMLVEKSKCNISHLTWNRSNETNEIREKHILRIEPSKPLLQVHTTSLDKVLVGEWYKVVVSLNNTDSLDYGKINFTCQLQALDLPSKGSRYYWLLINVKFLSKFLYSYG